MWRWIRNWFWFRVRTEERLCVIMATLEQLLQSVQDGSTVDDSIISLLTNIKGQLDAVLAGQLPASVQAKVDEIFAVAEADKEKVAAAVIAHTPSETVEG